MAIQLGKYKKPGIYIEEIIKPLEPIPPYEVVTPLVIGVSRKGPVNNIVKLNTKNDLYNIFGPIDKILEKKGSYFHRTIDKMLESGPVLAMNLLLTDDNLDKIEYKSLSCATNHKNDITREAPYRRFFDTTGFWKRDTESFINITKTNPSYNTRILNFTNLSDKPISIFIYKSKMTGYNVTFLEWYGSIEKVPTYINPNDYVSDYMVDVVIVAGDWSNYQDLAVDNKWSNYFNTQGLLKNKVIDFINDKKVTLLKYYEGLSLIPYFRDSNGKNIFIETNINADTDRTGLFCAFNYDLFETDAPNGLVDLIGNNIANTDNFELEFLSYKENIVETLTYDNVILDRPGNVIAISDLTRANDHARQYNNRPTTYHYVSSGNRTGWFADDYVYNLKVSISSTQNTITVTYSYNNTSDNYAYAVIGDNELPIQPTSFQINASYYINTATTSTYRVVFSIDNTGTIVKNDNNINSNNPMVDPGNIVLGYVTFNVNYDSQQNTLEFDTNSVTYNAVCVGQNGFVELQYNTDYSVSLEDANSGKIKISFLNTANIPNPSNYEQFRKIKTFNRLVSALNGPNKNKMCIVLDNTLNSMIKAPMDNMTVDEIVQSTTQNKSITITTGLTQTQLNNILNGYILIYRIDDEFIFNTHKIETKNSAANLYYFPNNTTGVVSKHSKFYKDYIDGYINSGDFFYSNIIYPDFGIPVEIYFVDGENYSSNPSIAGNNYIVFMFSQQLNNTSPLLNLNINDIIQIPKSELNKGTFTIASNGSNAANTASLLGFNNTTTPPIYYYAYKVVEEVEEEILTQQNNQTDVVYNILNKHHIKMYIDALNNLYISFVDSDYTTPNPIALDYNANRSITIQSRISNFKQSIEIETNVPGYIQEPNKILVNAARYTEVKVGDFLEAYVDQTNLQPGEYPKKLTRIISKKIYPDDPTLVEIICDSRIAMYNFNGDYQTFRYVTIEEYANTYKAITLKGFKIRQDSLPDGTEVRQNQILNLVAKGTPLYKALINKDAVQFRYLVDSFGLGLTERSKQQLVDICGGRLDVFGFINMPSIKQFKNSTSPSFVDENGVLKVEYIAMGGNPESNPAFLYSFGDGHGASCVGYFTPYVIVNDNGKPTYVPPAMFVATAYMKKHNSALSNITPWTIVAGSTNGKIKNIAGLEFDFTPEDVEFLNQAGMNPIVFKKNKGWIIETQNTAYIEYKTSLSSIHVREVLIELEKELYNMLYDFQWKYNTPEIRAEIKLRADIICEKFVNKNGIYDYFNKIDEENNTSQIIDNNMGVLDTFIEPIKGMGVIVNNIVVLPNGTISSGGFKPTV